MKQGRWLKKEPIINRIPWYVGFAAFVLIMILLRIWIGTPTV